MTSRERIKKALLRQEVDQIPVVNIFNQSYLSRTLGIHGSIIKAYLDDPLGTVIGLQERLKHDPVINLYTFIEPGIITWPSAYLKWPEEALESWAIEEEVLRHENGSPVVQRRCRTPRGTLTGTYRHEAFTKWVLEPILKADTDYTLLEYRPDPEKLDLSVLKQLIDTVGDRAFSIVDVSGCFNEYCWYRDMTNAMYDLYDCPGRVKAVLEIIRDYNIRLTKSLSRAGIDAILLNESSVGLGLSPQAFREFVLPYDQPIVEAAHEVGLLVSYHICGKSNNHLEMMADSGADAIEVLAPPEVSGDVILAEAKKRVGDRVGLWGGFNERVLAGTDTEAVKAEVFKCLDAAAKGGGYVLRGAGQIYQATPEAWDALIEAVEAWQGKQWK